MQKELTPIHAAPEPEEPEISEEEARQMFWESKEDEITKCQAAIRGMLARKKVQEEKQFYQDREEQAVKIQATWKGVKARKEINKRKEHFKSHESLIVKVFIRYYPFDLTNGSAPSRT